ncbi:MAG TPA: PIN domain-containing protein [Byssovorax sp.]
MLLSLLAGGVDVLPLWDERIVSEYQEVLSRPDFALPRDRIEATIEVFTKIGCHVPDARALSPQLAALMPDASDRPFLEVALTGGADALVTRNLKDFPASSAARLWIATPKQVVASLRKAPA